MNKNIAQYCAILRHTKKVTDIEPSRKNALMSTSDYRTQFQIKHQPQRNRQRVDANPALRRRSEVDSTPTPKYTLMSTSD